MKQTALLLLLLALGTVGPFVYGPFLGVAVYYLFAVLRPQFIWEWALLLDLRWSLYVAAATIAATVLNLPKGGTGRMFNFGHAVILLFFFWLTMSNLFAINSDISGHWYWEYVKIFVMFFCSSFIIRKYGQVRALAWVIVGSLGYIAFEVNSLYFFDMRLDIFHLGYGGLDNNGAGLMLAMGVPIAYFLSQAYGGWRRWFLLGLVPIMIHAVLMSYSRGAMVSLLIVAPLWILRSRNKAVLGLSLVAVLLLVPILAGKEIRERFFSIESYEEDRSVQSRFESWNAGLSIAKTYPIFGAGIRNSDLLSQSFGADVEGRAIHSQYIQTAADSGFPALGLYLLVLFIALNNLRVAQKRWRRSDLEEHQQACALAAGIESAIMVFCVGATFLSLEVFELPYLLILLAYKLPLTLPGEVRQSTPKISMVRADAPAVSRATV
jgi:probable O-glycosylation ligase (exosortase A-associated)